MPALPWFKKGAWASRPHPQSSGQDARAPFFSLPCDSPALYSLIKFFPLCFLAVLLLGISPALAAGEEFVIAKNGRPEASVVALPDSGILTKKAVADLLATLKKMTGSEFEKSDDPKKVPAIVVGLASEWAKLTGDGEPVKALAGAEPESFLLRSAGGRLLILGKDDNGASHGVYTLLRDLGCRWYFLTDDWAVIPQRKDIRVSENRVEAPTLRNRGLSNGAGHGGASARLFEDWKRRNRLGSAYGTGLHHSYANFVPPTLFKERPELFAWVSKDGEGKGTFQNGAQPCTTHPEVIEMFKKGALERLREIKARTGKAPNILPVSPNDGTNNMCRCERCIAVGTYGDTALLLANQVAEAIHEEFPETLVGFLAYGRAGDIPKNIRKGHPNTLASIAAGFNYKNSVPRLIQEWLKIVPRTIIYEYYAIGAWGAWEPDNILPNVDYISQSLRSWRDKGLGGVEGEISNEWASCGLRLWAFAELGWDLSQDPKALREDFYKHAWGAAAEPMRRYFERWESGQAATPRALRQAFHDLDKAAALANTPEIANRVDQMSIYLYWYLLRRAYDPTDTANIEKQNLIAKEGDMLQYRARNMYLSQIDGAVFKVYRPVPDRFSREEVAVLRRTALERFLSESEEGSDLKNDFTMNLIPVAQAASSPKEMRPAFSRASYIFRAKAGEKIEFQLAPDGEISAGVRPTGAENAELTGVPVEANELDSETGCRLQLWFLGPDGRDQDFVEEIKKGVVVGQAVPLSFVAPKDGLYRINSQMAAPSSQASLDFGVRPYVIAAHINQRKEFLQPRLARAGGNNANAETRYYFYVPKGTEAFVVNPQSSTAVPISFLAADGTVIEEVSAADKPECLVRVPKERDGAVWELRAPGAQAILLSGVPPWLSTTADRLLIPKE